MRFLELEISPETLFKRENDPYDDENSPLTPGRKQKMHLCAKKMGVLDGKQPSGNDFINYRIEQIYLKIQGALNEKVKDIKIMKTKIEKLESVFDEFQDVMGSTTNPSTDTVKSKKTKINQKKMCPNVLEFGSCPMIKDEKEPCIYAHSAIQLDLIDNEKKIANLENVIRQTEKNMMESHPPVSWKPTSKKDSILSKFIK